jgi:hypothetical protein
MAMAMVMELVLVFALAPATLMVRYDNMFPIPYRAYIAISSHPKCVLLPYKYIWHLLCGAPWNVGRR